MNDPKGLLSRWTRRNRGADSVRPRESGDPEQEGLDSSPGLTRGSRGNERDISAVPEPASDAAPPKKPEDKPREQEFDLSKLPPIESITAETDIRAFLAPGVPLALTREALRRAWVVDPKIRDFIEVAENQWDFTAPGVPGFDLSPPTGDIKQMLAQILGDPPAGEAREAKEDERSELRAASIQTEHHRNVNEIAQSKEERVPVTQPETKNSGQRVVIAESDSANAATQNRDTPQDERPTPKRGHGGAMPR